MSDWMSSRISGTGENDMKFWKMNGAGNDFIILNNLEERFPTEAFPEIARTLCERHLSIGADGLMAVDRPSEGADADIRMLFYNSDGSAGEMCGNGARCICRYIYENGLARGTDRQVIETTAGIVTGERISARMYRIRLNDPSVIELRKELVLYPEDLPFETGTLPERIIIPCSYVELGCPGLPHLAVEYTGIVARLCHQASGSIHLQDADETHLRELGRALRWHRDLPKGANVNFFELTDSQVVFERTFERGVEDFTYACGTGTGSVAAVLSLSGRTGSSGIHFSMRGGDLFVDIEELNGDSSSVPASGIYLTGPTNIVAKGDVTDEELHL